MARMEIQSEKIETPKDQIILLLLDLENGLEDSKNRNIIESSLENFDEKEYEKMITDLGKLRSCIKELKSVPSVCSLKHFLTNAVQSLCGHIRRFSGITDEEMRNDRKKLIKDEFENLRDYIDLLLSYEMFMENELSAEIEKNKGAVSDAEYIRYCKEKNWKNISQKNY